MRTPMPGIAVTEGCLDGAAAALAAARGLFRPKGARSDAPIEVADGVAAAAVAWDAPADSGAPDGALAPLAGKSPPELLRFAEEGCEVMVNLLARSCPSRSLNETCAERWRSMIPIKCARVCGCLQINFRPQKKLLRPDLQSRAATIGNARLHDTPNWGVQETFGVGQYAERASAAVITSNGRTMPILDGVFTMICYRCKGSIVICMSYSRHTVYGQTHQQK